MRVLYFILSMFLLLATAHSACPCPRLYQPVCARNGRTYGNDCEMRCAGAHLKHRGPCRRRH